MSVEPKWTLGRWALKIRSGTSESTANEVIAEIEQADPEGGYRGDVARLQSAKHIGGIADEELIANAHLLFAAPDLYAALDEVLRTVEESESWWMGCPDRGGFDVNVISAALAKARGEA